MAHRKNLICSECDHRWFESHLSHRSDGIYVRNRRAKCSECGSEKVDFVPEKDKDFGSVAFGKFASASPEQKSEILKKRSREHYKKRVHERAVEMDRNPKKYT